MLLTERFVYVPSQLFILEAYPNHFNIDPAFSPFQHFFDRVRCLVAYKHLLQFLCVETSHDGITVQVFDFIFYRSTFIAFINNKDFA